VISSKPLPADLTKASNFSAKCIVSVWPTARGQSAKAWPLLNRLAPQNNLGSSDDTIKTMPNERSHAYCWMEWILLAFGLPGLILRLSRMVTLVIPAAQQGGLEQRYLLSLVGPVIAEWLFVIAAWLFVRHRHESFRECSAWSIGNWAGWSFALLFAALAIAGNLRFFPRMGMPLSYAFAPRGFHLVASLATANYRWIL
jgi:hypothetical protein